ncbi:MAG: hypothetical protein O3C21_11930, partial [Verrucomicrobia bacterium]|nr:hypothetical protein [Verrucomicrobiota bacterium]
PRPLGSPKQRPGLQRLGACRRGEGRHGARALFHLALPVRLQQVRKSAAEPTPINGAQSRQTSASSPSNLDGQE